MTADLSNSKDKVGYPTAFLLYLLSRSLTFKSKNLFVLLGHRGGALLTVPPPRQVRGGGLLNSCTPFMEFPSPRIKNRSLSGELSNHTKLPFSVLRYAQCSQKKATFTFC